MERKRERNKSAAGALGTVRAPLPVPRPRTQGEASQAHLGQHTGSATVTFSGLFTLENSGDPGSRMAQRTQPEPLTAGATQIARGGEGLCHKADALTCILPSPAG